MRVGWSELLGYWHSLGDGTQPPMRGRFDPVVALPRAVAHLTLFGVEALGFRLKIIGSEAGRWIPGPMAGRLLDEIDLPSPIRDSIRDGLRRSMTGRQPVLVRSLAEYDEPMRWTSLYLPLTDQAGAISAVVTGSFHETGEPIGKLRSFRADTDDAALRSAASR